MNRILEANGLTKSFGGLRAIHDVDLHVCCGEILGLIGPNGAGKTTLFSLLSGFLFPDQGEVFFRKEKINGLKPHDICKRGLARTFQIVQPFAGLTVLENVMAGGYNTLTGRARVMDWSRGILQEVGLFKKMGLPAASLTLCERKKLELARALATCPSLILLDEVMAGLNPTEVGEMIELIEKIREKGITVLLIEHVMKAIMKLSERVIVLHHGNKISEGTPERVTADPAVVRAYLGAEDEFSANP